MHCDIRSATEATARVCSYIHQHFERFHTRDTDILIDKTPSNALRVPFVDTVFPEAKFINIVRDGRDNLFSRQRQWEAKNQKNKERSHTSKTWIDSFHLAKDRFKHLRRLVRRNNIPLNRLPTVVADMGPPVMKQVLTGVPQGYGERVPGLTDILKTQGVDAAAASQWRDTVMHSVIEGRRLNSDRYLEVRFEDLFADSEAEWNRILSFLGKTGSGGGAFHLKRTLKPRKLQEWRNTQVEEIVYQLEPILRPPLEFLGYDW